MHIKFRDKLTINLGVETMVWYNQFDYAQSMLAVERMGPFYNICIDRADGVFHLINKERGWLELGIGLFPYKYNPDATNLGEYLFRTGTYPGWIVTTFDWPLARISALCLRGTLWKTVKNDLLISRDVAMWPFNDISLTDIASFSIANILEIGGGIQFARILPANRKLTTPEKPNNILKTDSTLVGLDSLGNPVYKTKNTYYTHTGTKLMARVCIDSKGILPLIGISDYSSFMKKDDGKIFGEMAILGLKDQGEVYDTLYQRMPVMFGMNWFTHPFISYPVVLPAIAYGITKRDIVVGSGKFDTLSGTTVYDTTYSHESKIKNALIWGGVGIASGVVSWAVNRFFRFDCTPDLISFQLEYYGSPYPNSFLKSQNIQQGAPPLPSEPYGDYTLEDFITQDNWKWSLYFSKTIAGHFRMIGLLGRDHTRLVSNNLTNTDYDEAMTKRSQWYWMGKLAFNF